MSQKTLSERLFSFCAKGHKDSKSRKALSYPEWLLAIRNDERAARQTFTALQAACLTEAFWASGLWDEQANPDTNAAFNWLGLQSYRTDRFTTGDIDPLADAVQTALERRSYGETAELTTPPIYVLDRSQTLHELATEAASRDPASVTPPDIANFMTSLAIDPVHCAVYVEDGIGLLYGTLTRAAPALVATDLGRTKEKHLPESLQNIYETAATWYRNQVFVNRSFAELQWNHERDHEPLKATTLLVNASQHLTPFADTGKNSERRGENGEGTFNHLLHGPFKRIIALVSNSALTNGRQTLSRSTNAEDILRFCVARGLSRVIQLPMGTTGNRHLGHTVLVFDIGSASHQVEFSEIPQSCTKEAIKGFGRARRARQLHITQTDADGLPAEAARKSVSIESTRRKDRKLISFEANLFLDQDPLSGFRHHYNFVSLGTLVDIFRVQHLAPESELFAHECAEIGASDIDEWGYIGMGRLRTTSSDIVGLRDEELIRRDDLLLCFRGSSDSFGRVAWVREKPPLMTLPNQSFLVLRPKSTPIPDAPPAGLIFWWLRSPQVRKYLEQRAVTTGVSRISPRDVAAIEIPCSPADLLEKEAQRFMEHERLLKQLKETEKALQRTHSDAWKFEKY